MNNFYKSCLVIITIIILITSCAPVTTLPVPTATAYIPVSQNTPIPLAYETITSETAHELTSLARWEIDLPVDNLVFASNSDVLCSGNRVVLQSWDMFSGEVESISTDCDMPSANRVLGTKVISLDNHYKVEVDSGTFILDDLKKTDRSLFLYSDNVSSVDFSPDGQYLVIGFANGNVWFVPMSTIESLLNNEKIITFVYELSPDLIINVGKAPLKIYFSTNNSLLAFIFEDQTIQLWSVSSLSHYSTINDPAMPVPQMFVQSSSDVLLKYKIAFAANNQVLATASTDNYISLWDVKTGKLLVQLKGCQENNKRMNALVFSPTNRLLASLYNGNSICVWGILPENLDKAQVNATAIAESVLNSNVPKVSFPKPTITPTSGLPPYQSQIPLAWSIPIPTTDQIKEARDCSVEFLATSRYPEKMSYGELENTYPLKSSCEWAALAFAYQSRFKDNSFPEEGKRAFFEAIRQNPAFALNTSLFYAYFNSMELVSVPPLASQPIKSVVIDYEWNGMGEPSNIQYHIEIDNANSSVDQMKISVQAQPKDLTNNLARTLDPQNIQDIGKALTDFLPVQSPFTLQNCTDNYPDWSIELAFLDGTVQIIKTHESNFFDAGGPWFMELNGQNYVQFSSALVNSVLGLFERLNLYLGQPSATFCSSKDVFELAYP